MPPFSSPSKFSCFPKPTRLPSWRARVLAPRTRPRASARERHTTGVASSRRTSRRQGRSDRRVRRRRRKAWRAAPRARAGTEVTSDPGESQRVVAMADAAAPAPTQPAGAEDTIRVRVRQQEPAGEHDLSLPIDVRPSRRSPRVRRARLPHLSSRVVFPLFVVFFFRFAADRAADAPILEPSLVRTIARAPLRSKQRQT